MTVETVEKDDEADLFAGLAGLPIPIPPKDSIFFSHFPHPQKPSKLRSFLPIQPYLTKDSQLSKNQLKPYQTPPKKISKKKKNLGQKQLKAAETGTKNLQKKKESASSIRGGGGRKAEKAERWEDGEAVSGGV